MSVTAPELVEWVTPEQAGMYERGAPFRADASGRRPRTRPRCRFSREDWDRCGAFGLAGSPRPRSTVAAAPTS